MILDDGQITCLCFVMLSADICRRYLIDFVYRVFSC